MLTLSSETLEWLGVNATENLPNEHNTQVWTEKATGQKAKKSARRGCPGGLMVHLTSGKPESCTSP